MLCAILLKVNFVYYKNVFSELQELKKTALAKKAVQFCNSHPSDGHSFVCLGLTGNMVAARILVPQPPVVENHAAHILWNPVAAVFKLLFSSD